MVPLWVIKLVLTPTLIATVTLVSRRWGAAVGGWLVALPLTSGPVSFFLAIEQGPVFAASAAKNSILGCAASTLFCIVYCLVARRAHWFFAGFCGIVAYVLGLLAVSQLPSSLGVAVLVAVLVFVLALRVIGHPAVAQQSRVAPPWDLPLRMAVVTCMVMGITMMASALGPQWSGLVATFPVFVCVLTVFAHAQDGLVAAEHVSRGIVVGSFGFLAFFVAVWAALGHMPLLGVYALACGAAIGINMTTLHVVQPRRKRQG